MSVPVPTPPLLSLRCFEAGSLTSPGPWRRPSPSPDGPRTSQPRWAGIATNGAFGHDEARGYERGKDATSQQALVQDPKISEVPNHHKHVEGGMVERGVHRPPKRDWDGWEELESDLRGCGGQQLLM